MRSTAWLNLLPEIHVDHFSIAIIFPREKNLDGAVAGLIPAF
jgi:hypothetical protein